LVIKKKFITMHGLMDVNYRNLLSVHPLPTVDTTKEGKGVLNVNLATGRNRQCVSTKFHTTCKGGSGDDTNMAATRNFEISAFFSQEM
jgi:hypothetical protein